MKTYRDDIDGLRAIAVLSVILFHLKVVGFNGGFIGVDIFFVVSGYLISGIVISDLQRQRFSFKEFYIRRTARILPALLVTVVLTLIASSVLLLPDALVDTAQQSIAATLSVSNIFFWQEVSYWGPAAESYPLLHTWSLGVEEQFYLVYPLILFLCHRFGGRKATVSVLVFSVFAGFLLTEWQRSSHGSATFYLAHFRFYEFAMGGAGSVLVAQHSFNIRHPRIANGVFSVALLSIIYGVFKSNAFTFSLQGSLILVPLGGAVVILMMGPTSFSLRILGNPLMSWLGKTSYALYLVHWPIITLYRYHYGGSLSVLEKIVLFLVIVASAEALNRGVERRLRLLQPTNRTLAGHSPRYVLAWVGTGVLFIVIYAGLTIRQDGWPSRIPVEAQALIDIRPATDIFRHTANFKKQCTPKHEIFCGNRSSEKRNILLLGDSRGLDIYRSLSAAYPDASIQASYAMGCAPVFSKGASFSQFFPDCFSFNQARLAKALEAPPEDVIFLAMNLDAWRVEAAEETVKRLRDAGKTVFLLGEFRILGNRTPIELAVEELRFSGFSDRIDGFLVEDPFSMDNDFADRIREMGAIYVSNKPFLNGGRTHYRDTATGKLLSYDGSHLNVFGARAFGDYLRETYPID